ncbi:WS/DGAT domain-containing protein [Streptomyces sp. NPDC001667]
MTIAALLRLSGPPLSLCELADRITEAWSEIGRLGLRPSTDAAGRLRRPYSWTSDGTPAKPPPVSEEWLSPGNSLDDAVAVLLNRSLPVEPDGLLWDVRLLHDRLTRQQAVVFSAHHALLDAQSLAVLVRLLCQGPGGLTTATAPGSRRVFTPQRPSANARTVLEALRSFSRPARLHRRAPLVGPQRVVGWSTVARATVSAAQHALPNASVTVNDVALAAFAGALRTVPDILGDRPRLAGVRSSVPVSFRPALAAEHHLGNLVTLARVRLPVDVDDRARRLQLTYRAMAEHKRRHTAFGAARITAGICLTGSLGVHVLAEAMFANPWMASTSFSNVRLCDAPLRFGRCQVEEFSTFACLPPRMAMLAMFTTYREAHTLTVTTHSSLHHHLPRLAAAFASELHSFAVLGSLHAEPEG